MAYSVDLRRRIVSSVLERGLSVPKAAKTFEVGTATVERYLRRYRQSGELHPRTPPGRPSGLREHEDLLRQQVVHNNDMKLEDRCRQWEQATGARVSTATMSRWLKSLKLSRKKSL